MIEHLEPGMRHADIVYLWKAERSVKLYFRKVFSNNIEFVADIAKGLFDKRKKSRLNER
jgi:hypothetical protein